MAGIYVHIPFCSQACHYCDFHFSTSLKIKTRVISAIQKEIEIQNHYLKNKTIETIYFGGGTPSLIEPGDLEQIYNTIKIFFKVDKNLEFTIEANPEDVNREVVERWYDIGVNRISLGVQSFNDADLKYMNRIHNGKQAKDSIEILKKSKINNVSVDLIYGFPSLNDADWRMNLSRIIDFNVQHISCYCLTVEKKTPLFYLIKKGDYSPINTAQTERQFLITRNLLIKSGYEHYEISNFSKPGFQSKHNNNYWNQTYYLGIGPSAHSFNGKTRHWNINNNINYCNSIENNINYFETEKLTKNDTINEYILTSLRKSSGIRLDVLKKQMKPIDFYNINVQIKKFQKEQFIRVKDNIVSLTESGMLIADSISSQLFLI